MRTLVLGRSGQLARSLADAADPGSGLRFAGRPQLDLEVPGSARELILASAPDVVINTAAYTAVDQAEAEPERALRVNATAAGEAAQASHDVGARFVHLSTDYVFDGTAEGARSEDAPVNPLSVYGRTKLDGEERVRAAGPEHLILRTSWVVSPFGRNFVRTMIQAAQHRNLLTVVDDQRGCPTSALDLAQAILVLIAKWDCGESVGLGETYHLAGTGETSWCGLASFVMEQCRVLGLPSAEVKPIRTEDRPTPARRPMNSVLNSGKFARESGIVMPGWRDSVAAIVARIAAESQ